METGLLTQTVSRALKLGCAIALKQTKEKIKKMIFFIVIAGARYKIQT